MESERGLVPGGARQRILIVSSDCLLRERLYEWLTQRDYEVTTVSSGKIGLELLQHTRPNLIVVNSGADNCDGWGIADRIRRFDVQLPIVLLSPMDHKPVDTRTLRDVQVCLPHDISESELIAAVHRWIIVPHDRQMPSLEYSRPLLLIDDESQLLCDLETFLRPRGCPVVRAGSGAEGLVALERCNPAVVLLDVKMPGMDGLVTLKKIKEMRPDLPVVMGTAVEDQELIMQAFMLGAYEYLTKPYNLQALEELLLRLKPFLPQ